jgi:UDP-N-acetylglucosamine pyrophosphorylase
VSGASGMISEESISPIAELDRSQDFTIPPDSSLLAQTVVLKLNGGLGTGMGLDKAKSLLQVKGDDTFLDLTAKQVIQMRKDYGYKVKFMLMNSFSTSEDTMQFFESKYPALAGEDGLEMLQNKVPKLDATTFEVSVVVSSIRIRSIKHNRANVVLVFTACRLRIGSQQRMVPAWTW